MEAHNHKLDIVTFRHSQPLLAERLASPVWTHILSSRLLQTCKLMEERSKHLLQKVGEYTMCPINLIQQLKTLMQSVIQQKITRIQNLLLGLENKLITFMISTFICQKTERMPKLMKVDQSRITNNVKKRSKLMNIKIQENINMQNLMRPLQRLRRTWKLKMQTMTMVYEQPTLLTSFIWDMLIMLRLTSKMKEIKNIHIM